MQLTKAERQFIEKQWLRGLSKREIARQLDRNHSVICRAINDARNLDWVRKRNGKVVKTYCSKRAQQNYGSNKLKCGAKFKCGQDLNWLGFVENCVLAGASPKAAIERIKIENWDFGVDITARTFYNYVEQGVTRVTPFDLRFKLRRRQPKHKKIREHKKKMGKSIDERPESINNRTEFGHWEGDCIVDKDDNAILVCIERKSRFGLMRKLGKHESKEVLEKLAEIKKQYYMKSITVDNGSEFYKITQLEDEDFDVYFTHPYSSFEKGSVENFNGMIRRWIPKGTNLTDLPESEIERVQNWMNDYPREIHKFYTAAEVFLSLTNNEPVRILKTITNNVTFLKPKRCI